MRTASWVLVFLFVALNSFAAVTEHEETSAFDNSKTVMLVSSIDQQATKALYPWHEITLALSNKPSLKNTAMVKVQTAWHDGYDRPETFGKIKINGQEFDLVLDHTEFKTLPPHHEMAVSGCVFILEEHHLRALKEAKTVALRLPFRNHGNMDWAVPQDVLIEWQQTISRAEKDLWMKELARPSIKKSKQKPRTL